VGGRGEVGVHYGGKGNGLCSTEPASDRTHHPAHHPAENRHRRGRGSPIPPAGHLPGRTKAPLPSSHYAIVRPVGHPSRSRRVRGKHQEVNTVMLAHTTHYRSCRQPSRSRRVRGKHQGVTLTPFVGPSLLRRQTVLGNAPVRSGANQGTRDRGRWAPGFTAQLGGDKWGDGRSPLHHHASLAPGGVHSV